MTVRGDFHMHTHFSFDCMTSPEAIVRRCQETGLNCIAVTDHNSIEGSKAVAALAPFMVILGEEIKSTAGEITGLFIHDQIEPGLPPLETARRIKEQGGLVSIPHPFTGMGRSSLSQGPLLEILPYVDIVEGFNARTMNMRLNEDGRKFAEQHNLAITAVSDAHTLGELGHTYTEFPEFDGTPNGFKEALRQARYIRRPAPKLVHLYSTVSKLRRRFSRVP